MVPCSHCRLASTRYHLPVAPIELTPSGSPSRAKRWSCPAAGLATIVLISDNGYHLDHGHEVAPPSCRRCLLQQMSKASTNSQKQVKRSSSTTTPTSTSIPSVFIATVLAVAVSFLVMRYSTAITAALPFLTLVVGNNDGPSYKVDVDAIKPLTISAEGINATFIGHGARLTSLYVNDKDGNPREVVVGYDDPAQYVRDTATTRSFFGCVAGRYANRIKNGTFQIDGTDYQVPKNEHNGLNTLHGGDIGYDGRNWTVTAYNTTSITYTLIDPSGFQGFPGALVSHVTYSVSPATSTSRGKFTARIIGISLDQLTPVNLVTHIYWNLGSFTQPTILNDTLHLPYGNRVISTDSIQVPTGELQSVKWPWASPSVPLNFTSPKSIGEGSLYSKQCGDGCTGIDNAFILDRPVSSSPESQESAQLIWSNKDTGLTMKIRTNQQSIQLYDCTGMKGTYTSHASQGSPTVGKYGCLVIEPQQWIDGINHPEWGQSERQFFGPQTGPSVNWAEYDFSV